MANTQRTAKNALPTLLRTQLRNARKRRNLSQADLAEAIESTYRSVRRWENGEAAPTWHQLEQWVKALGYSHLPFYLEPFHVKLGVVRNAAGWDSLGVEPNLEQTHGDMTPVLVRIDGTVVLKGSEDPVVRSDQVTEKWRKTIVGWFDAFA